MKFYVAEVPEVQYKRKEVVSAMRKHRWHLYGAVTVLPDGRANSEMFVLAATPDEAVKTANSVRPINQWEAEEWEVYRCRHIPINLVCAWAHE